MESYAQTQWPGWAYTGVADPLSGYSQLPDYPAYLAESMDAAYQSHQQHLVHHHQMSRTTESKPRLSKEEVEILEAEFQKNHKPNSNTKKALAESMRVENARINNWFQNRRAREKKENNIRKYEAKQKLEREKAGSEAEPRGDNPQKSLVASSAPFPSSQKAPRPKAQGSDTSSDAPAADDIEAASHYCGSNGLGSPIVPAEQAPLDFGDAESEPFENEQADNEQLSDYFVMSDANSDIAASNASMQSPEAYLSVDSKDSDYLLGQQYQQFLRQNDSKGFNPSHGPRVLPDAHAHAFLNQQMQQPFMPHQETDLQDQSASATTGQQLKSPPSIDIASRRNRRPPPLAINGSRSFSSAMPKTSTDSGRRRDFGNPMRRVASATGSGRIAKPLGTPRSPFHDPNVDALFHLNRSPNMAGPRGTAAPPTPNTPAVTASQQNIPSGVIASTLAMDGKVMESDFPLRDPTLRTPPTTPGLMDSLFNLNSAYGMPVANGDGLATPSRGFSSDFELSSMPTAIPSYIANGNDVPSQPETPLYPAQMGPAYFGFTGGNPEYNWPDASVSGKSSPSQLPHHANFMNMTPSNFHGE